MAASDIVKWSLKYAPERRTIIIGLDRDIMLFKARIMYDKDRKWHPGSREIEY